MKSPVVLIIHIFVSILLIGLILLQNSKGGLEAGFAEGHYRTKRGAERLIFIFTIILTALFLLTSVMGMLLR